MTVRSGFKLSLVATVSLLAGVLLGAGGLATYQRIVSSEQVVRRPDFVLPDLNGKERDIAEWGGKILIVNFWATWCPPCRREVPMFVKLQKKYGSQGVQFIGVAVDHAEAVKAFAKAHGINYPLLHGIQRAMDVSTQYGDTAGTLPYTVVIDRKGDIRRVFPRVAQRKILEGEIENLLQQPNA